MDHAFASTCGDATLVAMQGVMLSLLADTMLRKANFQLKSICTYSLVRVSYASWIHL